ncbi:Pimeloyl-ACP methyl ester carboxylesterase [Streptomyces sp. 2224.1]|uniref:alpha/beta fold hydrolase n=1 Tax=Streptomyces sp. 2224.1 TaxID=1881020 RepID=UPI00089CA7A4|nr:alpha/beta hydrolase [Streptomyces sp. 2224.1]SEC27531.1 Pimeloyl-ACP methyl ester carboxylesterase [Streptomyces sp. 2224.1]
MSRRPGHVTTGPYAPPVPRTTLTVTSADGARLHAEVHGPKDAPAVVLAHGWTCSTAFWAPVVRDLAAEHKVVVYDQRGHGRSPAAGPAGHSTHALADDLVAVLDATLRPDERAVLGGHSMGGMTIMAAAGRPQLRERAAAALLCSTGMADLPAESRVFPLRSPQGRRRAHRLMLHSRAPLGPVSPLAKRALKYATMGPGATAEQIEACARIVHACPPVVRARWGRVLAGLELTGGVGGLELPTAVLAGTADRLTPLVQARRLASVLPDCLGLTELPGRGHMTPVEDPGAVAGRLRELVGDHLRPAGTGTGSAQTAAAEVPRSARQKKEKTV